MLSGRGRTAIRRPAFLAGLGVLVAVGVALTALAVGAPSSRPADFAALLHDNHYDYEPVGSPRELRDKADLVIVGRIVDVTEGRTIHGIGRHATLVVAVDKTIDG